MPQEENPIEGQVRELDGSCNSLMKQRPADIEQKEIRVERIQRRIQEFLDRRKINSHVLDAHVIAVDENGRGSDAEKTS